MALSTGDFDAWYDTAKNPDSFYKILGNNYEQVIENVWPDDFEKQKAFKSFFKEILEMGGNDKKLTRDLVVAGVYGLNPGVNSGSARKILTLFIFILFPDLIIIFITNPFSVISLLILTELRFIPLSVKNDFNLFLISFLLVKK